MHVEQLSVFLENRAGRLSEVTRVLWEAGINIRALSLADTSDFGILRLIVTDHQKARQALKDNGFTVGRTLVVAAEIKDQPGGLHHILDILGKEQVNVEYMYAFVHQDGHNAVLIFRFDRTDRAVEILKEHGIRILTGEEIYNL